MAHWRNRYIETQIQKALKWSPCVVLLGMRQTGKTSVIKRLAKQYLTFDDDSMAGRFQREGNVLLQEGPFPLALDEAQKHPPLFNQLKIQIDANRRVGRYLLSGSVRFSQKKDIRESLTGRTAPFELFPLSVAESNERTLSAWIELLLGLKPERWIPKLESQVWATLATLESYQKTGGLPGICFKRDAHVRTRLFEQHLDTLLGRDIHLLSESRVSFESLRLLLSLVFASQGSPINVAALAREVALSAPAVSKYLRLFEALFLVRRIKNVYYAEDQGLFHHCTETIRPTLRGPWYGIVFHEIRNQIALHHFGTVLSYHSTRGGSEVPFILTIPKKGTVGITFDLDKRPSEKSLRSLESVRRKTRGAFLPVALHLGTNPFLSNRGTLCIPIHWIF